MATEVTIRSYNPMTDDSYIYSTWSKYAWYSSKDPISISKHQFFKQKNAYIKDILQNGVVKVACVKDDPYVIMGYIVVHNNKVEWLCVKKDYHNQGIEELLKRSLKGRILDE